MTRKKADVFFENVTVASFVGRIEAQEEEKAEIAATIRSIYAEAEAKGFDPKALREVVKWRKADQEKLLAYKAKVEEYARELGLLFSTPLGDAALRTLKEAGATVTVRRSKVPPAGDDYPPGPTADDPRTSA